MPQEKLKQTIQYLINDMRTKNMSDVKVHVKLETLLKEEPIQNFRAQQGRIIVYQLAFMAAIFSPIFLEAKQRLKALLKDFIIYSDGLRPDELSAYL